MATGATTVEALADAKTAAGNIVLKIADEDPIVTTASKMDLIIICTPAQIGHAPHTKKRKKLSKSVLKKTYFPQARNEYNADIRPNTPLTRNTYTDVNPGSPQPNPNVYSQGCQVDSVVYQEKENGTHTPTSNDLIITPNTGLPEDQGVQEFQDILSPSKEENPNQICRAIATFAKKIFDSFAEIDPDDLGSTISTLNRQMDHLIKSTILLTNLMHSRSGTYVHPPRRSHTSSTDQFSNPEEFIKNT